MYIGGYLMRDIRTIFVDPHPGCFAADASGNAPGGDNRDKAPRERTPMSTYYELLQDPQWQRRRLEILQRNDFRCEKCGSKDETLHVHHVRYVKGWKPWEYPDNELSALCATCHTARQGLRDKLMATVAMCENSEFVEMFLVGMAQGAILYDHSNDLEFRLELGGGEFNMGLMAWFGRDIWGDYLKLPEKSSFADVMAAMHAVEVAVDA